MGPVGDAGGLRRGQRVAGLPRVLAVVAITLGVLLLHVLTVENAGDGVASAAPETATVSVPLSVSPSVGASSLDDPQVIVMAPPGDLGDEPWVTAAHCGLALLTAAVALLLAAALLIEIAAPAGSTRPGRPGRLRPPGWPGLRLSLGVSQV